VRGVSHVVSVELAQVDEIIPARRPDAGAAPELGEPAERGPEQALVRAEG
jgi:hypothetical protein